MPRAIVAGAVHRPSYRAGELAAEGPDEDAFTLAVAAGERVLRIGTLRDSSVDGIHLVGDFPAESETGLPEVFGRPHIVPERHGTGLAGLGAALRAAARSESDGISLVLVADVTRAAAPASSASGAGAVALVLAPGPGLAWTGAGGRRHPAHRTPDAEAWVVDAERHGGLPSSGVSGTLYFVAAQSPPVLLAFWRRRHEAMPIVPGSATPAGVGAAPSVAPALWLLDLAARADAGEWNLLAQVAPEESRFLGLRRTGAVAISDAAPDPGRGLGAPPPTIPDGVRFAVSEGAYVPRARYLENLPSRWRLVAERCGACGAVTFPMRGRCRACGRTDGLAEETLPPAGKVLAATVVAPGAQPTEFDPLVASVGAYGVVLAEMAPGVRVTLQVADHGPSPLAPGQPITTALRRLYPMEGEWRYGRKALVGPPG